MPRVPVWLRAAALTLTLHVAAVQVYHERL